MDFIEDEEEGVPEGLEFEADDDVSEDDIVLARTMTVPAIDIDIVGAALDSLPTMSPLARSLITLVQEIHQLLGDADAHLANQAADLEAGLRLHFAEFAKDPGAVLLGVLAAMPDEAQLRQIKKIRKLLGQREARILRNNVDTTIGRSFDA